MWSPHAPPKFVKCSAERRGFQPYHNGIPKHENLEDTDRTGVPTTTMMLRNIPNRYTQATLMEEIDQMGFEETYDFFYLPMDVRNRNSVGYAFINFTAASYAASFQNVFGEHRFRTFRSGKTGEVSEAFMQGFEANLLHFSSKAVARSKKTHYRPVVIRDGQPIEFEDAAYQLKMRLGLVDTSYESYKSYHSDKSHQTKHRPAAIGDGQPVDFKEAAYKLKSRLASVDGSYESFKSYESPMQWSSAWAPPCRSREGWENLEGWRGWDAWSCWEQGWESWAPRAPSTIGRPAFAGHALLEASGKAPQLAPMYLSDACELVNVDDCVEDHVPLPRGLLQGVPVHAAPSRKSASGSSLRTQSVESNLSRHEAESSTDTFVSCTEPETRKCVHDDSLYRDCGDYCDDSDHEGCDVWQA